jgi:hypothetical protein
MTPPGGAFTPKQLQMEKRSGKLYWVEPEDVAVRGRKPHWHCIRGGAVRILSDNAVKGCHFAALGAARILHEGASLRSKVEEEDL